MLPWLHPLSAFTSYELHGFTTLFLSERQKMVVLLPYNQITAASFSMPFLPYFNQKGSVSLYSALDLHYICKDPVWVVIPLLTMTRVDLPKNKSKLCQTLSLCFWFGTTKWITKEIFRVHTARIVLNLKWELNKSNRRAMSTVYIFHHGRRAELLMSLCSLALERQWSHRSFSKLFGTLSHTLPFPLCFSSTLLPASF